MSTTIPGGAYLSDDGKTWHDANGKPIEPPAELLEKARKPRKPKTAEAAAQDEE